MFRITCQFIQTAERSSSEWKCNLCFNSFTNLLQATHCSTQMISVQRIMNCLKQIFVATVILLAWPSPFQVKMDRTLHQIHIPLYLEQVTSLEKKPAAWGSACDSSVLQSATITSYRKLWITCMNQWLLKTAGRRWYDTVQKRKM